MAAKQLPPEKPPVFQLSPAEVAQVAARVELDILAPSNPSDFKHEHFDLHTVQGARPVGSISSTGRYFTANELEVKAEAAWRAKLTELQNA